LNYCYDNDKMAESVDAFHIPFYAASVLVCFFTINLTQGEKIINVVQ